MSSRLISAGITHSALPNVRYFEAVWATVFYAVQLVSFKPDVVLIFFADYGEAGALALARLMHVAKIVFVAGYPVAAARHRFEAFKAWGLGESLAAVVAVARHMNPGIQELIPLTPVIIPNGVDTDVFRSKRTPEQISRCTPPYRLLTVAASERRKGFSEVLAALPDAIDAVGDIEYTIVGEEANDSEWLDGEIQSAGMAHQVRRVRPVEDISPILDESDVFLLPSHGEGLPIAYLEAMSMGLPTIVSTDPPYDDIAHPEFSIQVAHGAKQDMVDAIVTLLTDSKRRYRMAVEARKEIEKHYTWPIVAQQYLALFDELLRSSS